MTTCHTVAVAAEEKPRIFQNGRDMIWSLALLVVVMVGSVAFTGLCSYNPGAPEAGPVQEVDAESFMGMEARAMSFPVRLPDNPEGWVTNSARRTQVNDTPAPVVGWVTADTGYIQMTQTDQPLDDAVRGYDNDYRELSHTESIGGEEVEVYLSEESDVRELWVADLGDVRMLFSGAASEEEFRTLIEAAVSAEPLPAQV